eukprot:NODE_1453_length_2472_cov_8.509168.p1 GENE.NODE_1453_length_2472_cov_8.509168~~NODE_1453_length_2472_cov_8.509168.p1  ORF type:complete len:756 (+),score=204.89 NODE_1453_length_2472_cov_8.509168:120-2387(+)
MCLRDRYIRAPVPAEATAEAVAVAQALVPAPCEAHSYSAAAVAASASATARPPQKLPRISLAHRDRTAAHDGASCSWADGLCVGPVQTAVRADIAVVLPEGHAPSAAVGATASASASVAAAAASCTKSEPCGDAGTNDNSEGDAVSIAAMRALTLECGCVCGAGGNGGAGGAGAAGSGVAAAPTLRGALSSLRALALAARLREPPLCRRVAPRDLLRCVDAADYLRLVAWAPCAAEDQAASDNAVGSSAAEDNATTADVRYSRVWLWFWTMPSPWLFRLRPGVPWDEGVLRRAAAGLVRLHPSFRMRPAHRIAVHYMATQATAALALAASPGGRRWSASTRAAASEALQTWWPRVIEARGETDMVPWAKWPTDSAAATLEGVLNIAADREDTFDPNKTPCARFTILRPGNGGGYGSGDAPLALLHVNLTHAFADGFSVLPLLADLNTLYSHGLAARVAEKEGGEPPPLPPALEQDSRDGPRAMEQRFLRSLHTLSADARSDEELSGGDACHLAYAIDYTEDITRFDSRGRRRRVRLVRSWARAARRCGLRWGCSLEVVLLTSIVIAFARVGPPLFRFGVPLSMVTPLRDGPGDAVLIGQLADQRHFDVRTSAAIPLLEVLLGVSQLVRERLGRMPEPLAETERVLVNIVPLPDVHGPWEMLPYDLEAITQECSSGHCHVRQAADIYCDELLATQADVDDNAGMDDVSPGERCNPWELTVKLSNQVFPDDAFFDSFCAQLGRVPTELLVEPLRPTL